MHGETEKNVIFGVGTTSFHMKVYNTNTC